MINISNHKTKIFNLKVPNKFALVIYVDRAKSLYDSGSVYLSNGYEYALYLEYEIFYDIHNHLKCRQPTFYNRLADGKTRVKYEEELQALILIHDRCSSKTKFKDYLELLIENYIFMQSE